MKKLECKKTDLGTELTLDGQKIGTAVSKEGCRDTFVMMEEGVVCWTRRTEKPVSDMKMRFEADYELEYQMIPALQYNGNNCFVQDYIDVRNSVTEDKEVKRGPTYFTGFFEEKSGDPWRFSFTRSSIAAATYSEGAGMSAAMFLPKDKFNAACSVYPEDKKTVHEMLWPEQDGPLPLSVGGKIVENYKKETEGECEFSVILVLDKSDEKRTMWHKLLDAAWKQNYVLKSADRPYDDLWDLGVAYTKLLYTEEADGFKGFSIGYTWDGEKWAKRDGQKYEIGWCGQNASLANSLLAHAKMTGDQEAADMGIAVLDAWIAAKRPNGLIPTHYDDNMYTNGFEKTVDACNLGTAAVQFFEAEKNAQALGIKRPEYSEMAIKICDFALDVMNEQGRIGKSWLEKDLSPAVKEGSTGAFLTMALCDAAKETKKEKYLEAAKKSCGYYIQELTTNGYTTAGALDIFSIDKESSIPLLKSSLMLYEHTGDEKYIEYAKSAAWYLSTWQWHYTKEYPEGSLLNQMGFDTFGGTAVSIHGGMDPYALFYVHELCDLAEYTGNEQWHQRASAIWRNGQQAISEGDYVLDGKAPRPVGSQDESISFSYGFHENSPSQWLVAWPTAFRLEALRRMLPDWGDKKERLL